jgi:two-component system sensor histidine kinase QseC
MMASTIQRRLTLVLTVTCTLLGAGGGSALYFTVRNGLMGSFDGMLRARAEGLAALIKEAKKTQSNGESAKPALPDLIGVRWPSCFQIWASSGETIERSPSLGTNDLPRRAGPIDSPQFWDLTLPDGQPARAVGIRFVPQKREKVSDAEAAGQSGEAFTLVIARHRGPFDHLLNRLKTAFILTGLLLVVSNVAIVIIVVRRELGSLSSLASRAATINASSLQTRFPTASLPGELRPICDRLNDLLARLEASFARERRFTADVAHELRTPIAELRAVAEVALKYPGDALTSTRALEDVLAVAQQMEAVSTGLLAMARCEAGLLDRKLEPVSLSTTFSGILPGLNRQIQAKNISVSVDIPDRLCWLSDAIALRPIIANLLTNAVEYTPVGGSIRISTQAKNGGDELRVTNPATHLTADDLGHVFERFWRKDTERSSSVHSGLGLPLARSLAEFLGLKLRAELSAPDEFTVVLSGAERCSPKCSESGRDDCNPQTEVIAPRTAQVVEQP